ncbi:MAG: YccF domain-containing protein [Nocardioides sp.]|uniref:YccF domain-containing protein n=1 Tax=Nocardioides sp. TaxID=35761 RepID=UPI003EFF8C07
MKFLLNVIWLVLSGFWLFVAYALAGVVLCVLFVTIPWGVASFRLARYALWPFGRTVVERPDAGAASLLGNIVWLVLAGWWLALTHIASGIALCLTIIGIPMGIADFKMVPLALMPLGKKIVPSDTVVAGERWEVTTTRG